MRKILNLVACALVSTGSVVVQGYGADFGDVDGLMALAERATPDDRTVAAKMTDIAREKAASSGASPDYGVLSKLWCDAVLVAPTVETLVECSRARFGAISRSSNLQGSLEDALRLRAAEGLAMLKVAGHLAKDHAGLDPALSGQLFKDAECLQLLASNRASSDVCIGPYAVK